jgi:hypothetical protein
LIFIQTHTLPYDTTLLASFMAPNDKDLYIKQFLKLKKGTPLYQPCAVQVGDVGFIDPLDGFFQKLYNIDTPPRGEAGGPPPIQLNTTSHREQCNAYHVCYLSYFILRTLPYFVIILAEEIKEVWILIESSHVGQPVAVRRPITETRSSAPKVKQKLYSQK